jgi:hypothetical protein
VTVPDEAVEAALVAFSDRAMLVGSSHRDNLTAALEAAAPFVAAQAWDEGFEKGSDWGEWAAAPVREEPSDQTANPYRSGMQSVAEHLRGSDNATTVRAMLAKLRRSGT